MFKKLAADKQVQLVYCIHGSHLYGLNTPNSDQDFKEVFVPSLETILLSGPKFNKNTSTKEKSDQKNTKDDIDTAKYSISSFLSEAKDGEMITVDLLHSDKRHWVFAAPEWEYLVNRRERFYTKDMRAYIGYIKRQVAKYGNKGSRLNVLENLINLINNMTLNPEDRLETIWDKLPIDGENTNIVKGTGPNHQEIDFYEILGSRFMKAARIGELYKTQLTRYSEYGKRAKLAASNEGVDWKAVSHAFRACYQLLHIYENGGFRYPLPETDRIMEVKLGGLDYKGQVEPELDGLFNKVVALSKSSSLPASVDPKFLQDMELGIYNKYFKFSRKNYLDATR